MNTQMITLAGGCFWCLEAVYERVDGVVAVESGYANGQVQNPSYAQVCEGDTGHAEVVRVSFDAERIGLREILEIFFTIHDPTTLNRQGNDVGPQYRSGIYWHDEAQAVVAREVIEELNLAHGGRVVTELAPLANYWRAEDVHQHYFAKHPNAGYCAAVVAPKVEKFRRTFKARVRA
jgi:peptide-methionine (S)-S-oxide reductase